MVGRRLAAASVAALFNLVTGPVAAAPVPADELSLLNGSDLYALHCSECHGVAGANTGDPFYGVDDYADDLDYESLLDEAQGISLEEETEEEWPEWAEMPDPGTKADEASVRAEILAELTRAIDDVYEDEIPELTEEFSSEQLIDRAIEESYVEDTPDYAQAVSGATDLSRPETFFYGTSEQALYASIAYGVGASMPGWVEQLDGEEAIWDLVNYIRSLWGEDWYD